MSCADAGNIFLNRWRKKSEIGIDSPLRRAEVSRSDLAQSLFFMLSQS